MLNYLAKIRAIKTYWNALEVRANFCVVHKAIIYHYEPKKSYNIIFISWHIN